jgi:hypothetical protein
MPINLSYVVPLLSERKLANIQKGPQLACRG